MLCYNEKRGIRAAIFLFLCFYSGKCQANKEYRSLNNYLKAQRVLIEILEDGLLHLEGQLGILNRFLDDIHVAHLKSKDDPEAYLSNPLNSFPLIRRTYEGWPRIVEFLQKPFKVKTMEALNLVQLPTRADLREAALSVDNIRRVRGLSPKDVAEKFIKSDQQKLSAFNLFTIGFELYKIKEYEAALLWLNVSLHTEYQGLLPSEFTGFNKAKSHLLYVGTLLQLGRGVEAVVAAKEAFDLYPEHDLIIKMNNYMKEYALPDSLYSTMSPEDFEKCCRKNCPQRQNGLYCRYNATMNPFHVLAPSKMEELSLDPYIVIFHDVLTDKEMQSIKNFKRKTFPHAKLYYQEGQENHTDDAISHPVSLVLKNSVMPKISALTGMDQSGFEYSAVLNYGLDGHYGTHTDFFEPTTNYSIESDGRPIASMLIYLTDVEQGGATMFPGAKIAVFPQKASLLLWYNLKKSGEVDLNVVHGSCPVFDGSKWVLSISVRERPQFRSMPCYNP